MRAVLFLTFVLAVPEAAFAHLGHLGEVAGHGHWVALGAGIAAAALAAWLAKEKLKAKAEDESEDASIDGETETQAEPAGA